MFAFSGALHQAFCFFAKALKQTTIAEDFNHLT